jgi:hypothetical protein
MDNNKATSITDEDKRFAAKSDHDTGVDKHVASATYLQPEDYEQIAIVQSATKGKSVVVDGGGYTAETWELERKMRTFQQLRMARRLRANMEHAYEDAKKAGNIGEALKIFESHKKSMIEMISLTDAVKGGYTLGRYDDYAKVESDRAKNETRSHLTAQSIFSEGRKRMAWENSTDLFIQESRAEQLGRQIAAEKNASRKKRANNSQAAAALSAAKKVKAQVPPSNILPQKTSSINTPQPTPKQKPAHAAQSKAAKKTKIPSRKCHYCRTSKTAYFSCTFWHNSGKQCKKNFCKPCIQMNPAFKKVTGTDWQCPACLGTCDCDGCMKPRNQERPPVRAPKRRSSGFDDQYYS